MRTIAAILAVLSVGGCTMDDGEAPSLTGPSEFGLSVTMTASPDRLPRDGSSQSVVTVTVRDASSRPVSGQRLALMSDIGLLSDTDVVTGGNGQATVTLTAPPAGAIGNNAMVFVAPFGTDSRNAALRTLDIALIGPSNTTAPTFAPIPFVVIPSTPEVGAVARLDASGTVDATGRPATGVFDEGAPCMNACSYSWDFGDGNTATGRAVSHTFTLGRTHMVTLVVTDAAGTTNSTVFPVPVNSVPAPTVTISVSPASPPAGQMATIMANAQPAPGHSIQSYDWNFGDGSTTTTKVPTVVKTFSSAGIYVVTVTVTDDLGQQGSNSLSISVGGGISFPQPPFTVSPATPLTGQTVSFNAGGVTTLAGATITQYEWDFGDGQAATEAAPTASHSYAAAGTYVVRLTVTDSSGRTGTATVQVTVDAP
jgi:PKD repeat protein